MTRRDFKRAFNFGDVAAYASPGNKSTQQQAENKRKVFGLLGNRCSWVDDSGPCRWGPGGLPCDDARALVVDHVNGRDEAERARGRGGNAAYVRYLRHLGTLAPGVKSDKIQLLCHNHNWIKRFEQKEARGRLQHRNVQ